MALHACLKNEFTEAKMNHNLMRQFNLSRKSERDGRLSKMPIFYIKGILFLDCVDAMIFLYGKHFRIVHNMSYRHIHLKILVQNSV